MDNLNTGGDEASTDDAPLSRVPEGLVEDGVVKGVTKLNPDPDEDFVEDQSKRYLQVNNNFLCKK